MHTGQKATRANPRISAALIALGLVLVLVPIPMLGLRAEPQRGGPPQVVVLQNGNLVQGRVERGIEKYRVSNGPWYSIRIPIEDIDFVATDMTAAYRVLLSRVRPGDLEARRKLAQWCLRHDLDRLAADQLLEMSRIDPHHSAVTALEKQLLRRMAPPPTPPASPFQFASHRKRKEADQAGAVKELPPLPPDAVPQFTRAVQPLLMNRCGQTTCHGNAGESSFRLLRTTGRGKRQELTLRNLRSVFAFINREDPAASPLLSKAFAAHGKAKQASFEPHETDQMQRLRDWVFDATGNSAQPVSRPVTSIHRPGGPRGRLADHIFSDRNSPASTPDADSDDGDPLNPERFNRRHEAVPPSDSAE